jgi:hypothetical protein
MAFRPDSGSWPPLTELRDYTHWTPPDEWSARGRDLHLTKHNTRKRQTPVGFEPAIAASERPQTRALDRAVTGIGGKIYYDRQFTAKAGGVHYFYHTFRKWFYILMHVSINKQLISFQNCCGLLSRFWQGKREKTHSQFKSLHGPYTEYTLTFNEFYWMSCCCSGRTCLSFVLHSEFIISRSLIVPLCSRGTAMLHNLQCAGRHVYLTAIPN